MTSHAYIRAALGYVDGMRMLLAALKAGTLADPQAIERELERTEKTLQAVLRRTDDQKLT